MSMVFARKKARSRVSPARAAGQGVLWDPTLVGRSFAHAAMTFRSGEEALRQRLNELELRRRRAQIKARRVVEDRDDRPAALRPEQPVTLPFAS